MVASPGDLKKLSTYLVSGFFLHVAVWRLADLSSHASFLHTIAGYNVTLMKFVFVLLSTAEIACVSALVLPGLVEHKFAPKVALVMLTGASFVEAMFNFIAWDTNAATTFAFLMAASTVRVLEAFSSRSMLTFHGEIGDGSPFDACLGRLRDAATRYKAAALCTLGIAFVMGYTLYTTDGVLQTTTSTLRRNLAIATWQKSASFVSLLAAIGSCDGSSRRGRKKQL